MPSQDQVPRARAFIESVVSSSAELEPPQSRRLLENSRFRFEIYGHLHPLPRLEHAVLLRRMFEYECAYRRAGWARDGDDEVDAHDDAFEGVYWCAFLLHRLGALVDVLPMWRAKHIDMDTSIGFDIEFIVGAGVDRTLEYLRSTGTREAVDAAKYIADCRRSGHFNNLPNWLDFRANYFKPLSE